MWLIARTIYQIYTRILPSTNLWAASTWPFFLFWVVHLRLLRCVTTPLVISVELYLYKGTISRSHSANYNTNDLQAAFKAMQLQISFYFCPSNHDSPAFVTFLHVFICLPGKSLSKPDSFLPCCWRPCHYSMVFSRFFYPLAQTVLSYRFSIHLLIHKTPLKTLDFVLEMKMRRKEEIKAKNMEEDEKWNWVGKRVIFGPYAMWFFFFLSCRSRALILRVWEEKKTAWYHVHVYATPAGIARGSCKSWALSVGACSLLQLQCIWLEGLH